MRLGLNTQTFLIPIHLIKQTNHTFTIMRHIISTSILLLAFCLLFQVDSHAQSSNRALTAETDSNQLEWAPCPEFMPETCRIAVLHGNPAEPNADIFFKLEGNTSVPNHWHHSAERMVLVSGEMQVNYEGQQPETLTPGMYAYGPPEVPHTASCESSESCVLFIAFEEPVDAFEME